MFTPPVLIRPELQQRLVAAAKHHGFEPALPLLLAEARECAYFRNAKRATPSDDAPGISRLGGWPDLPADAKWPVGISEDGKPNGLAPFVAQFNLADVPDLTAFPLPRTGVLSLFVRSWTAGVQMVGFHFPDPSALSPRPSPAKAQWSTSSFTDIRRTPIRFERGVSLPMHRQTFRTAIEKMAPGQDWSKLAKALEPKDSDGAVGGYSTLPEHDLQRWVALRHLGQPDAIWADEWPSPEAFDRSIANVPPFIKDKASYRKSLEEKRPHIVWLHENRRKVAAETAAWLLLARFDANMDANIDLGDGVTLDVYVRRDDLEAGKFERITGECPMVL